MFTVKTMNQIADCGINQFDKTSYMISDNAQNPDAIIVRSAEMNGMTFEKNLIAIARAGAGVNNIPVDECTKMGICVFNTPGANANAVKELVVAGLLLSSRRIPAAIQWAGTLSGADVPKQVEKGKGNFVGPELLGKTLGIIGLGAIGVQVANAAIALGMKVYGYDPYLSVNAAWGLAPSVVHARAVEEIYQNSDYITLHLPATADTKGMFDKAAFASMKDGVRLLNFARGELVKDADLLDALSGGKVSCYVTDFPNEKLLNVENIVAIPHLGASTPESEDNCAVMAAQELVNYLETGNIKNSVNLPDAEMIASATKMCIIHKNVPALLSRLTAELSKYNLNIENLLNKSKKEMAYSMFDISGEITPALESDLSSIDGVIRVRILK